MSYSRKNITFCKPGSLDETSDFENTFDEMERHLQCSNSEADSVASSEHSKYCCFEETGNCICRKLKIVESFMEKSRMEASSVGSKVIVPGNPVYSEPQSSEQSFHSALSADVSSFSSDKSMSPAHLHNQPVELSSRQLEANSDLLERTGDKRDSATIDKDLSSSYPSSLSSDTSLDNYDDGTNYKNSQVPQELNEENVCKPLDRNVDFLNKLKTIIEEASSDNLFENHGNCSGVMIAKEFDAIKGNISKFVNIADLTVPTFDVNHSILNLTNFNCTSKPIRKNPASPLLISTLRNIQTSKCSALPEFRMIVTPASPGSPAKNLNESSFTLLEKECGIVPRATDSPPKISSIEAKCQEYLNQLNDSPVKPVSRKSILISDPESCDSPPSNFSNDFKKISYDSDDLTQSIEYELALRKKRCYETENAIYKEITSADSPPEISGILNKLKCIDCSRASSVDSLDSQNTSNKMEKSNLKSAQKNKKDISSSSLKSISANSTNNKSSKILLKTPTSVRSQRICSTTPKSVNKITKQSEIPKLSRPIGLRSASKVQTGLSSASVTPRRLDNQLKLSHSSSSSSKLGTSRTLKQVEKSSPMKLTGNSLKSLSTPKFSSTLKTPNKQNNLSQSTKSYSSKLLSPCQTPKLVITQEPSTPKSTPKSSPKRNENRSPSFILCSLKNDEKSETPTKKNILTPRSPATGNVKNIPKTPKFMFFPPDAKFQSRKTKPTSYFSPAPLKKPIFEMDSPRKIVVNSPVAGYINSTDAQFIQNVKSTRNEYLCTPVKNNNDVRNSTENLAFKLGPKTAQGNLTPTLNIDLGFNKENDEHVSNVLNLPDVSYHLPPKVREVVQSPKKLSCQDQLLKPQNSRQVIRHQGRVKPSDSSPDTTEYSLYIKKSAEKTKFVYKTKTPKK